MDVALAGRVATVEEIHTTLEGDTHVSVTIDDDPGRDFGGRRYPGHRFFFRADELELLASTNASARGSCRILIAGIGNIFFGDDAFGVAVARSLAQRTMDAGVVVSDFGIRGLDLAYALQDFDAVILLDAVARGDVPGTLYVVDPTSDADSSRALQTTPQAHGMDPARVLALARSLGKVPQRILLVGCEPESTDDVALDDAGHVVLSPPVAAAVARAEALVHRLIADLQQPYPEEG